MKKYFLAAIMLIAFQRANAQYYSGTIAESPNTEYATLHDLEFGNPTGEDILCLNVKFHFIRMDNGFGMINDGDIPNIISSLNNVYNNYQISFNDIGSDIMKNSNIYLNTNLNVDDVNWMKSREYDSNALNIYVLGNILSPLTEHIPGNCIFINGEHISTKLLVHEIGHCLNLYHTHHGSEREQGISDPFECEELPDGSNGKTCGDYIRSTPADPGLLYNNVYYVDENCNYTQNDEYNPDTHNFMSYTRVNCMQHFTNEQAIRMRRAIVNAEILKPLINCSCTVSPLLIGNNTLLSTQTENYELPCGSASGYTCSSNLSIIAYDSNSVTVKPINSTINGPGWIKINGSLYQKDIWIGKPKVKATQTLDGEFIILNLTGDQYTIDKQNITGISWETVDKTEYCSLENAENYFETIATGTPGTQWNINARIEVANDAGIYYYYDYIAPPIPDPCETGYQVIQSGYDEYMIDFVDPCDEILTTQSESYTNEIDIIEAQVFDFYGNVKRSYKKNSFNVSGLKKGIYILRVVLNNSIISYKFNIE